VQGSCVANCNGTTEIQCTCDLCCPANYGCDAVNDVCTPPH
jgi:hypothetical protein